MRTPDPRDSAGQDRDPAQETRAGQSRCRSRERTGRLDEEQIRALKIVGAFRVVDARDIAAVDVKRLIAKGLMKRRTVSGRRDQGTRREGIVLTAKGRDLLRSLQPEEDPQKYYAGLVKPGEVEHDMAIYPAFRQQAAAIEQAGGKVRRVVLDYELKSAINREMNREGGPSAGERRRRLAEEFDLPVVGERLALPDLRIEYTDAGGREQCLDVEVMTRHYRGAHRAGKASSGFRLVNANSVRAGVDDDHHLGFWG
jgi:DNA-binding MarR family transcriptional regulator